MLVCCLFFHSLSPIAPNRCRYSWQAASVVCRFVLSRNQGLSPRLSELPAPKVVVPARLVRNARLHTRVRFWYTRDQLWYGRADSTPEFVFGIPETKSGMECRLPHQNSFLWCGMAALHLGSRNHCLPRRCAHFSVIGLSITHEL